LSIFFEILLKISAQSLDKINVGAHNKLSKLIYILRKLIKGGKQDVWKSKENTGDAGQ
jgi:hypothetical protein